MVFTRRADIKTRCSLQRVGTGAITDAETKTAQTYRHRRVTDKNGLFSGKKVAEANATHIYTPMKVIRCHYIQRVITNQYVKTCPMTGCRNLHILRRLKSPR